MIFSLRNLFRLRSSSVSCLAFGSWFHLLTKIIGITKETNAYKTPHHHLQTPLDGASILTVIKDEALFQDLRNWWIESNFRQSTSSEVILMDFLSNLTCMRDWRIQFEFADFRFFITDSDIDHDLSKHFQKWVNLVSNVYYKMNKFRVRSSRLKGEAIVISQTIIFCINSIQLMVIIHDNQLVDR